MRMQAKNTVSKLFTDVIVASPTGDPCKDDHSLRHWLKTNYNGMGKTPALRLNSALWNVVYFD